MPNWTGGIITAKGRELQAKVEAGETLIITKMKLGSGTPQAYEMDTLTDLKQPLMEFGISSKTVENNICEVTGVVVSSEIETPFYAREWGLFAQDPDEGEILYMYTTDPNPDFIPAKTAALQISATYALNIVVLNVDNIIVNIDPNGLVTTAILKNELKKYLPLSGGDMTGDITANNVYANNNVLVFNSVAEMKASNKVKSGYTIKTLGFYEANDGGEADYVITNDIGEDEADEASIIALQKGLYAKLLVQDYVNVKQFGAKGDEKNDDTEAINKAISYCKENVNEANGAVIIPKGTYAINSTIYLLPRVTLVPIGEVKIIYNGEGTAFSVDASYAVPSMQEMAGLYTSNSSGYIYLRCANKNKEGTVGLYLNAKKAEGEYYNSIHPHFKGLVISDFYTTIKDMGNYVYFLQFTDCVFNFGVIGYQFGDGLYSTNNAGERCTFTNCIFSQLACCFINWGIATINLINCSLDYSALGFMCYFTTTINISNSHMEGLGSSSLAQLDYEGARGFLKFNAKQETEDLRTKCVINMNEVIWVLSSDLEAFKVDATRNSKVNINANGFNVSIPDKNIFENVEYTAYFFPKDKVILNLQSIQKSPTCLSPFNYSDTQDMYFLDKDISLPLNTNGITLTSNGWSIYGGNTNSTQISIANKSIINKNFLKMSVEPNQSGFCSVTIPNILVKGRKISATCQVSGYKITENFGVVMYAIFKDIKGNYINADGEIVDTEEAARVRIGGNFHGYVKEEIEAKGEELIWSDVDYSYIKNIIVPEKAILYDLFVTMQVFKNNNNTEVAQWYYLGGFQVNTYD